MKTFVLTALMTTLLVGIVAPVATASSIHVDQRHGGVSCIARPLDYAEDQFNRMFANVRIDGLGYCDPSVTIYQRNVDARCQPFWSGPAFSWSIRVDNECDVSILL